MAGELNNAYFEQGNQFSRMAEEDIIQRISDCQMVVDKLEGDPVWKLVLDDATKWVDRLDSNWQEIEDEKQRNYARVLKFAYLHIRELPSKYKADLENARSAIEARHKTSTDVQRDYDLETKVE